MSASRDEAHLCLLAKKRDGEGDRSEEEPDIGFGTLAGGADTVDRGARGRLPRRK